MGTHTVYILYMFMCMVDVAGTRARMLLVTMCSSTTECVCMCAREAIRWRYNSTGFTLVWRHPQHVCPSEYRHTHIPPPPSHEPRAFNLSPTHKCHNFSVESKLFFFFSLRCCAQRRPPTRMHTYVHICVTIPAYSSMHIL